VDLYIHSPTRLHGIVLNLLRTGTTLPFFFTFPLPIQWYIIWDLTVPSNTPQILKLTCAPNFPPNNNSHQVDYKTIMLDSVSSGGLLGTLSISTVYRRERTADWCIGNDFKRRDYGLNEALSQYLSGGNGKKPWENLIRRSRNSVVGIAISNGLDDWGVGVWVPVGSRIFSSPRQPDRLWGPSNFLSNGYWGLFPRG
jgi:hypothetical protein